MFSYSSFDESIRWINLDSSVAHSFGMTGPVKKGRGENGRLCRPFSPLRPLISCVIPTRNEEETKSFMIILFFLAKGRNYFDTDLV
jgi:hypothetical protein